MLGPCFPAIGTAARAGALIEPAAVTAATPASKPRRVSTVMEVLPCLPCDRRAAWMLLHGTKPRVTGPSSGVHVDLIGRHESPRGRRAAVTGIPCRIVA